ncbi:DUF2169 family type VI secretion system accessory protein [Advenella mimigardefordensis]|uniref:Pentapeptide repeat-containing protein n=1 Tax=Advenella mimigardefordensis (strain DSM 17166 / LMG 22922 / DPN7) TaxID=1247726 RepID=W0PF45_ADVMD|nr:pentapeptide repeat-containing protein [Advenella mimigardefordensis]AHG65629.1 pentapeptide repeat-containing protein [Advenella mimigardefordensis DPN7]
MKIIKPFRAGLLTRPFQWRGQTKLAFGVYIHVCRDRHGQFLGLDQEIWSDILPLLDSGGVLDQVMPKAYPEYLISGAAYTDHQDNKTQCMVKVQVGTLEKTLKVTGDRFWVNNSPTAAKPFTGMPLDWSHAFGGQQFAYNPEGKGIDEQIINGIKTVSLPNIEDPLRPIQSKSDRPPPASFGPIGLTHPQRINKQGTYSDTWYKYDFPGFLPDMDPTIFNMAAEDQQWTHLEQLPLGDAFRIWNMNTDTPCWEDSIANLQARVTVLARNEKNQQYIRDVENMQASTLWLLPDTKSYIMMFHGSMDILDSEADDVEMAMAAIETTDEPRSADYYEQVLRWRIDPKEAMYHLDKDEELIPASLMRALEQPDPAVDKNRLGRRLDMYMQQQHAQTKAWFDQNGLDYQSLIPEFVGPPENPMDIDDNPDRWEKIAEDAKLQTIALMREREEPEIDRYIAELQNMENVDLKTWKVARSGPPDLDFVDQIEHSSNMWWPDTQTTSPKNNESEEIKESLRKSYLYSAHYQQTVAPLKPQKSLTLRAEIIRRYQQNEPLACLDFTGADLSHLDLQGADFSGSFLESANFENANITDADFSEAVLVRSRFNRVTMKSVNFTRANLAESVITHSKLEECNFDSTELMKISISNSSVTRSKFVNILSDYLDSADSTYRECRFETCMSSHFSLKNVLFNLCQIEKWAFLDCQLENTIFESSTLKDASITTSSMKSCEFVKSHLDNLLIEDDTQLIKCKFVGSRLKECTFINMTITENTFTYSDISESDFSKSRVTYSNFDHAIARDAIFHKTDLTGSSFKNANLIEASLEKANLSGVDFEGATLFRTNVSKVHIDNDTKLSGAYKDQLELYPVYRENEQHLFRLFANE